jgi:hypothetical protein
MLREKLSKEPARTRLLSCVDRATYNRLGKLVTVLLGTIGRRCGTYIFDENHWSLEKAFDPDPYSSILFFSTSALCVFPARLGGDRLHENAFWASRDE